MKITITFRHMAASQAVKDFATQKLEKLDKFAEEDAEAHVVLSVEKHTHNAEVVLHSKGVRATGKAGTSDMYASVEEAIGKVAKALKRAHDKKTKSKSQEVPEVTVP